MKRLLLGLVLGVSLIGCAYIGNQVSNIKACWANSECRSGALEKSKNVGSQAGDLGSLSGLPWAGTAAKAVGTFGSAIAFLAIGGAAFRKKNE